MSFCKLDEDIPERLHFFSKNYFPYPKKLITVCEKIIGDGQKIPYALIFRLSSSCLRSADFSIVPHIFRPLR